MAHLFPDPRAARHLRRGAPQHIHYIAILLLALVVIFLTLSVRDHKAPPQPRFDRPMTTPHGP